MKYEKAQEIVESLGFTEVFFQGKAVWIEGLNRENKLAVIKEIDSERMYEAPIAKLETSSTDL